MTSLFDDFKNAFKRNDNAVIQLILINIIVFLLINVVKVVAFFTIPVESSHSHFVDHLIAQIFYLPAPVKQFLNRPWSLITYFFSHEDFFHILFNMLFLYWFGVLVSEYLGNRRLTNIYVLGGLTGGLLYLLVYNIVPNFIYNAPLYGLIGASGAVYAVVVAAATLIPNYTFNLLLLGPVRIVYIAAFYIVISFISLRSGNAGGNLAHLGGALIGFIYIKQLKSGRDLGKPVSFVLQGISRFFTRKPKIKVSYLNKQKKVTKPTTNIPPDQAEIDTILDKISKSGYESLTKEEKQKLFSASQKD